MFNNKLENIITNHQESSNNYWSDRALEFSGLRMKEYYSNLGKEFKKYIFNEVDRVCNLKKCKPEDIKVLDVGTGAGLFSIIFREAGCKVCAIDFSNSMLKEAKKNLLEFGYDDVDLFQADIKNIPFDDNTFDIVWSRNVTWIIPCVESAYIEIYRVLKAGAIFINLDANYGKVFRDTVKNGEKSTHSTQSESQLDIRNKLAMNLAISYCDRPNWDRFILSEIGYSSVSVLYNFYKKFDLEIEQKKLVGANKNENVPLFLLKAIK